MTEINGICYADAGKTPLHILGCSPLDRHRLRVEFNDGVEKEVDLTPLLEYPVFSPLTSESVFRDFAIDHGILTWLGGEIDIAPEWLYESGTTII